MPTITLHYDARNHAISALIEAILKFDGVSIIKNTKNSDRVAAEIAETYSKVKSGKIKTRPVSQLLNEL